MLISTALTGWSVERKLAGISLGMKPAELLEMLGDPTAIIMAQPPLEVRSTSASALPGGGLPGLGDMTGGMAEKDRPNTLIFIYKNEEIELGASQDASLFSAAGSFGAPSSAATPAKEAKIPVWAYTVRATKLSLAQQEFIYQVNDTYSIGITITGEGAEARVSDIVACSFEPFTNLPKQPEVSPPPRRRINFYSPTMKKMLPAGTTKGIVIGSRLDEVLRAHGWPDFFFPYVTDEVSKIVFSKPHAKIEDIAVKGGSAVSSGPAEAPPLTGGMMGGASSATGEKAVTLTDGDKMTLPVGFTKNCLLLYLNDSVAITLVDMTVVRIQIGTGVVRPPDPPKLSPTP
jgi:hypothetical protein